MSSMTDAMKKKAVSELKGSRKAGVQDGGFTAEQTRRYNPFLEDEDAIHPLYEQRDNIRGYVTFSIFKIFFDLLI